MLGMLGACIELQPGWLGQASESGTDTGTNSTDSSSTGDAGDTETGEDPNGGKICDVCPWWDEAWTHRSFLDADGSEVGSDVLGLPVLVVLTPERFDYGAAASDGSDVRFVTDDGQIIAHEWERWSPGAASFAWIRADLLGGATTRVWIYYGNAAVPDIANPEVVWSDYGAVWHLDDLSDATANGFDGSSAGDLTIEGTIAGARDFDGFGGHVQLGSNPTLQYTEDLTISLWFRVESVDDDAFSNVLISTGGPGEMQAFNVLYGINLDPSGDIWMFWEAAGAFNVDLRSTSDAGWDDGEWHQLVVTRDIAAGNVRFYFDGSSLGSAVGWGQSLEPTGGGSGLLQLGADPVDNGWNLDGALDEVRLAPIVDGPERVFLRYRSESDTLWTYGGPQPLR